MNVSISIEPDKIVIGQQLAVRFDIEVPLGSTIVYPALSDTITGNIEIVRFGRPDTISVKESSVLIRQEHMVTSWREGYHAIPPIDFLVIVDNDTTRLLSNPVLIEVTGVVAALDDDIKDIKSILSIPLSLWEVLPYLVIGLFLATLTWLIYRWVKARKKREVVETLWEQPDIPAHIAAMSGLESLKSRKLWENGQVKAYHIELTEIMRMYISKRYRIHAMEMTTTEMMFAISPRLHGSKAYDQIKIIFELADMVKFARVIPQSDANEASMEMAFDFVDITKQEAKDVG